jgi:hypothetical protein
MSGSTSIPALIRYAIDYGHEGAALSAFVRQKYIEDLADLQEEDGRRRLDEEERLNEPQWEEEIKLQAIKVAIEINFNNFERSEWDSIKSIEKQEDEVLENTSVSIAERIIIWKGRINRRTETESRLKIAEQAMLEQLKNMTILGPKPTPATPYTPTLPQAEDNTHDATLSHKSDFVKITSPAPTESSINTAPDAPVDLNYTARQEPRRQNNKPTTVNLIGPMVLPTIGLHTKPHQPLANGKKFADKRRIALGPELPVAAIQGVDNQQSKLQLSPLAPKTGSRPCGPNQTYRPQLTAQSITAYLVVILLKQNLALVNFLNTM